MSEDSLTLELPIRAESPRSARRALAGFREYLDDAAYGDLKLLVSELVTDAVRAEPPDDHGIKMRIRMLADEIQVSVLEGAAAYPLRSRCPRIGEPGWGIHLLPMLADSWGTRHSGERALVWARMPVANR